MAKRIDPELLYVECSQCGHPLLWGVGDTTSILRGAGIDLSSLDERCMIVSEGCPNCSPGEKVFPTHVVRLSQERSAPRQDLGTN